MVPSLPPTTAPFEADHWPPPSLPLQPGRKSLLLRPLQPLLSAPDPTNVDQLPPRRARPQLRSSATHNTSPPMALTTEAGCGAALDEASDSACRAGLHHGARPPRHCFREVTVPTMLRLVVDVLCLMATHLPHLHLLTAGFSRPWTDLLRRLFSYSALQVSNGRMRVVADACTNGPPSSTSHLLSLCSRAPRGSSPTPSPDAACYS